MNEMANRKESDRKSIQEFYKMLLFLNESSGDYFFLWDVEEKCFRFAREISGDEYGIERGYVFNIELIEKTVYVTDRERVLKILENAVNGNYDGINVDFRYMDKSGKKSWVNCRGKVIRNENHQPYVVIGCLSRRMLADKIDLLTGLMNYNKMLEDLSGKIARDKRGHLLILGIDNFKQINQRMGRAYGNAVLKTVADVLEDIRKEYNPAYRLDGDYFAVDLGGYSRKETEKFYDMFQNRISEFCTLSAGAVAYPLEEETDVNILVGCAEDALDRAKSEGRNRMKYFTAEDYGNVLSRTELQQELKESIQNDFEGFEVYYQPQFTSNSYRLHGAEALLRYHSRKLGFLSPGIFIPMLEHTGMIVPVGRWVMKEAFAQCRKWREKKDDFCVSVNISYIQLREQGIVEDVINAVREAGIPGEAVTLEITESMQLQNYSYFNSVFYRWREYGIRISIDDFGTGYSSLSYLKSLAVDEVKIDRCFVSQIQKSTYNYRLLSNMLELTHSARIKVCCEGVEQEEEQLALDKLFPEFIQGFLFGRPASVKEFEENCLVSNEKHQQLVDRLKLQKEETEAAAVFDGDGEKYSFKNILDNLDSVVCLIDTESCEMCYMNTAAKKMTGVYDYHGSTCHEILFKEKERCANCNPKDCGSAKAAADQNFSAVYGDRVVIREKQMGWEGRPVRLIEAGSVEEDHKLLDRKLNESLNEAYRINMLYEEALKEKDTDTFVNKILAFLGKDYKADRSQLFIYDEQAEIWVDSFFYHDRGVMPKARYLEVTTAEKMEPWVKYLEKKKAVFIKDSDDLKGSESKLWKDMLIQDINNCMLCGIWNGDRLMGMLCLDNADCCEDNLALLKKAAALIEERMRHTKENSAKVIHEHVDAKFNREVLEVTNMGLWQIQFNRQTGKAAMLADRNMKALMGVEEEITPEECFSHWSSRIAGGYGDYVNNAVETMMATDKTIEVEYTWFHPTKGAVAVRCVGTKTEDSHDRVILEGYHRLLDDMEQIQALPRSLYYEFFEYHEELQTIYFHTNRAIIFGTKREVHRFPECWVEKEMVHPSCKEEFREFFRNVAKKGDVNVMNVLLLDKERKYRSYRMESHHLSNNPKDRNSTLVVVIPEENAAGTTANQSAN